MYRTCVGLRYGHDISSTYTVHYMSPRVLGVAGVGAVDVFAAVVISLMPDVMLVHAEASLTKRGNNSIAA